MDVPFADNLLMAWTRREALRRPVKPLTEFDPLKVRTVLLALTTGLGDAVLSTPVFNAVRCAWPQAKIALFVRSAWAPLFQGERDIDQVIPYHGKWRRFFSTLKTLRMFAPDLTLVLHGNDPDIIPLSYHAGSQFVVRVPTTGTRYSWLLSNLERTEDRATMPGWHYIDNRLRLLDSVGISATRRTPVIRSRSSSTTKAWLESNVGNKPYFVLHPWAADTYKTWPEVNVSDFLFAASERWSNLCIVLTGTTKERAIAERLVAGLPAGRCAIAAGEFSIAGTAELLATAKAVIAPDTGLLHLAAALNVPTVGLYSPTLVSMVGQRAESATTRSLQQPLTCAPCLEKKCPYPAALCMSQFTSAEVLAALADCLGESA